MTPEEFWREPRRTPLRAYRAVCKIPVASRDTPGTRFTGRFYAPCGLVTNGLDPTNSSGSDDCHEGESFDENILAASTTGVAINLGTDSSPSRRVCSQQETMSGHVRGLCRRRPDFSGQIPQKLSVTRHSQAGYIVAQSVGMNPVLKARPPGSTAAGIPHRSGSDGTIGGVPGSARE